MITGGNLLFCCCCTPLVKIVLKGGVFVMFTVRDGLLLRVLNE